jgi:hypothetical protein
LVETPIERALTELEETASSGTDQVLPPSRDIMM